MNLTRVLFISGLLLSSCQSESVPATIELLVDAEPQMAAIIAQLDVEVRTVAGAPVSDETVAVTGFPVRHVVRGSAALSPAVFSVTGRNGQGEFVTVYRTVRSFVTGTQILVEVLLQDACRGFECSPSESCVAVNGQARCEPLRGVGLMDAGVDGAPFVDSGLDAVPDAGSEANVDIQTPCTTATCAIGQWCNPASMLCEVGCDERRDCPASQQCVSNQCTCTQGTHLCAAGCVSDYAVATCGDRCEPCAAVAGAMGVVCIDEVCSVADCEPGFRANADRSACLDYNECEENNGGCPSNATCSDTGGRRQCQCNNGGTGNTCPVRSPVSAVSISSGGSHSCAIFSDNNIRCWGFGRGGPLGNGSDANLLVPQVVAGLDGLVPVEVSAGSSHTCARFTDGSLRCWGRGTAGQLGTEMAQDQPRPTLVQVPAGLSATSVAAGFEHTCAAFSDGSARCWGTNRYGEIPGTSRFSLTSVPFIVPNTGTAIRVARVASGSSHVCALTEGGQVLCWGADWDGQLGDGTSPSQPAPVFASLPAGAVVTQLSLALSNSCARLSNGTVLCWGGNRQGQAGAGSSLVHWVPVQVDLGGLTVRSVAHGGTHGCALLTDDTLRCWGDNTNSQLGFGAESSSTPGTVQELSGRGISTMSLGRGFSCAIAGGSIYCWGLSANGQLGNGGLATVPVPELSWEFVSE